MFAGKTTMLMQKIERHRMAGRRCLVVKYHEDTRYDDLAEGRGIVTHAGKTYGRDIDIVTVCRIEEIEHLLEQYDVIGVTESQFFEDIMLVADYVGHHCINFICEGLDGCFKRNNFGDFHKLIPYCNEIIKLLAVCECGEDAIFSSKISGKGCELKDIGGSDKYAPKCRACYIEYHTEE
jgi:thymidine kinase